MIVRGFAGHEVDRFIPFRRRRGNGERVAYVASEWRTFLYEARVRRADGEYRWMLHQKVAVRDEQENIVKWYGTSIDIEDPSGAAAKLGIAHSTLESKIRSLKINKNHFRPH